MSQAVQTITLRVGGGEPYCNERLSTTIITPGMLVAESSGTVGFHATAAIGAQKLFAQCNNIDAGSIDTDYAVGETVSYAAYHAGDEVNALVAAAAPAILDGDALESAGNGTVKKVVTDAATDDTQRNSIVGYAMVDVDNSGGGTSVRIALRVA